MNSKLTEDEKRGLAQPEGAYEDYATEKPEPYKIYETKEQWQAEIDKIVKKRLAEQKKQLLSQNGPSNQEKKPNEDKRSKFEAQVFSLEEAGVDIWKYLKDEDFLTLIDEGNSVLGAYLITLKDELKNDIYGSISKKNSRIMENGLGTAKAAVSRVNPNELSDKEFSKLMERIRKGDVIYD